MLKTIYEIENVTDFTNLLEKNPGLLILKFGAEWCNPCKKIEEQVMSWFTKLPSNVQTVLLDIDKSAQLYIYLKNKRMLNGIPGILMYKKGNLHYVFDDAVNNSNTEEIDKFFERCLLVAENM